MIELYDSTFTDLLDRHAPLRSTTYRVRPSIVWFDSECRREKAHVRSLERRNRSSLIRRDRSAWVEGLKQLMNLYREKQNLMTTKSIDENKNCPRQLWQTLNTVLGLSVNTLVYEHSA